MTAFRPARCDAARRLGAAARGGGRAGGAAGARGVSPSYFLATPPPIIGGVLPSSKSTCPCRATGSSRTCLRTGQDVARETAGGGALRVRRRRRRRALEPTTTKRKKPIMSGPSGSLPFRRCGGRCGRVSAVRRRRSKKNRLPCRGGGAHLLRRVSDGAALGDVVHHLLIGRKPLLVRVARRHLRRAAEARRKFCAQFSSGCETCGGRIGRPPTRRAAEKGQTAPTARPRGRVRRGSGAP